MSRRKLFLILSCCFLAILMMRASDKKEKLTVLQLNIWMNATKVDGAFESIVREIEKHQPDIVTLSEIFNYDDILFTYHLCDRLKQKGLSYYTFDCFDGGIISKYPILENSILDSTTINRAVIDLGNQKLAVYAAHLDYTHYACYLPRGYDGVTWKERDLPVSVKEVLAQNDASKRIMQIRCLLRQAERDRKAGCQIIIGGDFNEPSCLDWEADTKDLYDHHGFIIPWTTTRLLDESGYKDAYRVMYPSAVTHPGFTWVADNSDAKIEELAWAPKADERDRIDFVFYKGEKLFVRDAAILGPKGSILRGKRVEEISQDKFIEPISVWPSDHKGVWIEFEFSGVK